MGDEVVRLAAHQAADANRAVDSVHWDAIVIGTGLGGAHAGARLVDAGMKVLFVDRGVEPVTGQPAPMEQLEAEVTLNGRSPRRVPTTVAAVGGTSVIYAASLEQPERHDLDDLPGMPHPTHGWVVGYDAFAPYFDLARKTAHVCGTRDPLSGPGAGAMLPPPPLCPGDALIEAGLTRRGFHPYRAHLGINFDRDCTECIGRECFRECKADARQPLNRALASGRAALLSGWTAHRIEVDGPLAARVIVRRDGQEMTLTGDRMVLAAGSLSSAQLLLASRSEDWADGLGNRNGLVGRGLMFHLSERLAVWPDGRAELGFPAKSLALRDLYMQDGQRLGLVQSMGLQADYGNVLMHLRSKFDGGWMRRARPVRPFLRLPAKAAAMVLGSARVFVGILEDLPYDSNRVLPGDDAAATPRIDYAIAPELAARRRQFRDAIRRMLKGQRFFFLNDDVELNFGHACGTARFGADARTSVLDADCRVHGLRNLYLADASFMPTSTGVNPGLVILANSLRVADRIVADRARAAA